MSVMFQENPNVVDAKSLLREIARKKTDLRSRTVDRPLALYGAGDLGVVAANFFKIIGIPLAYVVDREAKKYKTDKKWVGYKLVTPDEVPHDHRESHLFAICIVNSPYVQIHRDLKSRGWTDCVPVYDIVEAYRDRHPLSNGWYIKQLTDEGIENIGRVIDQWHDDISRAHYLQFIAWRKLREEWAFYRAEVNKLNRYFIPEVTTVLRGNESFADVGAHRGEVTRRFVEIVKKRFENIWAIEPDVESLRFLRKKFRKNRSCDIW